MFVLDAMYKWLDDDGPVDAGGTARRLVGLGDAEGATRLGFSPLKRGKR